jgi:hypothetical protein
MHSGEWTESAKEQANYRVDRGSGANIKKELLDHNSLNKFVSPGDLIVYAGAAGTPNVLFTLNDEARSIFI